MTGSDDGPTLRRFRSQRLDLAVHDWGNRGAPPLLLIHGGRDTARSWDAVALALRHRFHILCPDLRGHGDSQWTVDGRYTSETYLIDLVQLIDAEALAPVSIIAHSLGGNLAIRYAGLYPDNVSRLLAIEGLGPSPKALAERLARPIDQRMREWIAREREMADKPPRRMATPAEAEGRMRAAHPKLTDAQVAHMTHHALRRNEGDSFSWKHDPRVIDFSPVNLPEGDEHVLWGAITCPTLLVYGTASWASDPAKDGRAALMPAARVALVEGAGHWVQHERPEAFMALVEDFLRD